MNALKIFFQMLIVICFVFAQPSFAHAELQGDLYGGAPVTEDGESFDIAELNKALADGNIAGAEAIYNEWVKRRQKMLKNGTEFGIFDAFLKHCHAIILSAKKSYAESIAAEDEALDYLLAHLNEKHKRDNNWINQIYKSMRHKKIGYDNLHDVANSLRAQKAVVEFLESILPPDNRILLNEKRDLSIYCLLTNDYETAIAIDEDLLPRVEKVFGSTSTETRALKQYLALAYKSSLRYSDAEKLYKEVLQYDIEIYGETADRTLQSYGDLIGVYHNLGKYEEMGNLLNRVVPIVEENLNDNSDLKQTILNAQAFYYRDTQQTQKEWEIFERLLAMPISNNQKIHSLCVMADDCRVLYDYSNALKYVLNAWDIYEKNLSENKSVRSEILECMSSIYRAIGKNQEAIQFAQEALDLRAELYGYDSEPYFSVMRNLAGCYDGAGQHDKAVELFKKAYELGVKLYGNDSPNKLYLMLFTAESYYQLQDYESGIPWAKEAINESIRLCGEKDIHTILGRLLLAKLYTKDKATRDEAIRMVETILDTESELLSEQDTFIDYAMRRLAYAYLRSSRWKEASSLYEKLIERSENRIGSYGSLTFDEKRHLLSDESSDYINAAISYYEDNNFRDAFRVLERGRSRILVDSYSEQLVKSSGILEEEEVLKLNEYKAGLINYANRIEDAFRSGDEKARFNLETEQRNLMNEYAAYKESLQNKYPKYKTVSQANKLDFDHDKNILPDDTAFVEYAIVSPNSIFVFIFDKTGDIKAVKIDMPKNFLSKCSLYREFLAHSGLHTTQEVSANDKKFNEQRKSLSKYLSEILLSPIKDYISGYSNLIISPDGDLNNIPFETLEFNDKLAVESFNISYVPSFSVLKLMYEAGEKNSKLIDRQDLFAMGNAFYGGNDTSASRKNLNDFSKDQRGKFDVADLKELKWDNLDGTKEEINRVSKMFAAKKIFSEKAASESNLKLSNRRGNLSSYKYFLFATHGIFIPYAPEYSSIVLSQGTDSKEDGYVTVGEWMGLDLNSDLVFLSACESGLGEYQAGEGIIGIPYALTIAGNKNTVMSLWKVYDTATAEFVSTFFKKISNGKSAVIALNETKREFLKSDNPMYQSPAVWAAFLLYGF